MQNPTETIPETEAVTEPVEPRRAPWFTEVGALLSRAAELCVEHGLDLDHFMRGAWSSYVESRPGMREHLEEQQLRDQLQELRQLGRVAEA